jgi:uncharacterized protein (DUF1330 family)
MTRPGHDRGMTAYALAHLHHTSTHEDVIVYLERIQATLDPYGGHFLIHGPMVDVLEGEWPGTVVVIEFPGIDEARDWYASPEYQTILPLRTDHLRGDTILAPGVKPGHDAAEVAHVMRMTIADRLLQVS